MARIGVILMERFEEKNYLEPSEYFKQKGYELVHVGLKEGMTVAGREKAIRVRVDQGVQEVAAEELDALFIPGNYPLEEVKQAKGFVELVEDFLEKGKPVWRPGSRFAGLANS